MEVAGIATFGTACPKADKQWHEAQESVGGAVLAVSRGLHRRAVGRERICDRCQPTFEEVG